MNFASERIAKNKPAAFPGTVRQHQNRAAEVLQLKRERCSGVLPILPGHEQQFLLSGVDAATSDPAEGMGTYYKRFTKTNEQERGRVYEHKDQGVLYRRSGS